MVGEGKADWYPCPFSAWCVGTCGGQDDLEKTEAIPISFMIWKSKASERNILSTFGAEASACRDALLVAEYMRAMLCEVVVGRRVLPDECGEEHLPIRVITECTSLFGCVATDASVLEDRGTALTVASLRGRCSAGVGRDEKRSGLRWVPTRVQLADGLTKSSAGVFLRNAKTSGTAQLQEESTNALKRKQLTSSSKEARDVSLMQKRILSRKIGGNDEYITGESRPRSVNESDYLQCPTADSQSIYHFPTDLW